MFFVTNLYDDLYNDCYKFDCDGGRKMESEFYEIKKERDELKKEIEEAKKRIQDLLLKLSNK